MALPLAYIMAVRGWNMPSRWSAMAKLIHVDPFAGNGFYDTEATKATVLCLLWPLDVPQSTAENGAGPSEYGNIQHHEIISKHV